MSWTWASRSLTLDLTRHHQPRRRAGPGSPPMPPTIPIRRGSRAAAGTRRSWHLGRFPTAADIDRGGARPPGLCSSASMAMRWSPNRRRWRRRASRPPRPATRRRPDRARRARQARPACSSMPRAALIAQGGAAARPARPRRRVPQGAGGAALPSASPRPATWAPRSTTGTCWRRAGDAGRCACGSSATGDGVETALAIARHRADAVALRQPSAHGRRQAVRRRRAGLARRVAQAAL